MQLQENQQLLSLDVESLFTNVPITTTIDIIIKRLYNHPALPPPTIPQPTMKTLLEICTTETPFTYNGTTYLQKNGVAMGTPLGPTLADFYMSQLENDLLSQNKISNPCFYVRYVDDILAIFNTKNHVHHFVRRLQNNSVLKFTTDFMINNSFHFLDIKIVIENNNFLTSVYTKPTDKGSYSKYSSHTLDSYKKSTVKTLINRAVKYSHSWEEFHAETHRLTQLFINNEYPLSVVQNVINKAVNKYFNNETQLEPSLISFYCHIDNLHTFNSDRKTLKSIITQHIKPCNNSTIRFIPYFVPYKLSSCFSTRLPVAASSRAGVVYQFQCNEDSCKATYVGYTTNDLTTRCRQHRYNPSSIYMHFLHDHHMSPPPINDLIQQFSVLYQDNNHFNLKIVEAIKIKELNPIINVKYNDFYNILKLY